MLAQLLGMGRVKKDKGKEREKGLDRDEAEAGGDGQGEDLVPLGNGSFSSGASPAGGAPQEAALHHHAPTTAGHALHANGGHLRDGDETAAAAAAADQAEANCGRCGRTHPEDGVNGDGGLGDEDSDGDVEDGVHSGGAARALAPGPPPGPSGFSSPLARTAVVKQPLGQKAFSVEVAGVERGLYIQLGEAGAKTEAQLGEQQLEAAKRLRHLLITNRERMVQELLSRGWVPLLLRWLGLVHRPNLQVEALSALTTVAQSTTEHTPLLLKHGAVLTLVSLLKSPSLEMVEQAMWVLGKMAQDGQDGTTARDAVLQAGVLGPLVRCLEQHPSLLSLQRIGAWSLFNLFDGQPRPTVDVATVGMVMPAINRLLRGGDSEVLSHACSTLSHLCDGSAAHIKVVVESGVCNRLVQLLDHPSSQVVKPALRTIGNVVCAEDDADYTEAILEAGSIVCLKKLIAHPNREIQKEACWTLSNIAAGSVSQIQSVLDSGAMPQLIKLATSADTESEVRSEAFWVVLNAASCGSDAQIEYLVSQGCVQILSDLLGESSMVMMALEGIERVLSVGDLRVVRSAIASHSHADQGAEDIGDHGGGHCMECASVAAVGAAAAAAAATAAEDGHEGDLVGDAGAYTNPYACMLTPEKIQALEAHKNSAVAKRANRVWARYFVTCAICRRSFSRHVSSATFCAECNCHVCGSCDCTVFHLAYQDKLWEEMEGKEKKGKQAQQAAKKSKKAKKREKKKNAAKEPVPVEPAKKVKVVGVSGVNGVSGQGVGVDRGKDSPVSKRAGGAGKDKGGRVAVQRSPVLGKKPQGHHRSPSPHKTSSSASTESNSEDEYSPSPPQNAYTTIATPAAPTSSAAAIINATAIAVTAAAKNANRTPRTPRAKPPPPTTSPPPPREVVASPISSPTAGAAATAVSREPHAEDQQRRVGKKQGRRDQQQQQQPAAAAATTVQADRSSSSRSPTPAPAVGNSRSRAGAAANTPPDPSGTKAENGLAVEDDDEEPWVVVGSRGGQQAAGSTAAKRSGNGAVVGSTAGPKHTKWSKGQQRAGDATSGWVAPSAPPPGSGGGASVVEWASESSPSATVRAVKVRSNVSTPPPAAVAPPRASPTPPAVGASPVHVVPSGGSGRAGGGSAWASVPRPAPQPMMSMPMVSMTSAAASATGLSAKSLRSTANGTGSSHVIPQRPGPGPGPGPGSVWGTSAPVVDARPTPFSGTVVNSSLDATAGPSARAPGARNRAGVIGPPAQAAVGGKSPSLSAAPKPVESPPLLLPTAKALSPLTASVNKLSASSLTAARGNGEAALAVGSRVSIPAKQTLGRKGSGGAAARSSSGGGDGEALVENEKLVSFLIETGSILALAQRLEEEEEWRRAAPSPASSGPS